MAGGPAIRPRARSPRSPRHVGERPVAHDLQRDRPGQPLPGSEHGPEPLLRRQAADEQRVAAGAGAGRGRAPSTKFGLTTILSAGKPPSISLPGQRRSPRCRERPSARQVLKIFVGRRSWRRPRRYPDGCRDSRRARCRAKATARPTQSSHGRPARNNAAVRAHQPVVAHALHDRDALRAGRVVDRGRDQREEIVDVDQVVAPLPQPPGQPLDSSRVDQTVRPAVRSLPSSATRSLRSS